MKIYELSILDYEETRAQKFFYSRENAIAAARDSVYVGDDDEKIAYLREHGWVRVPDPTGGRRHEVYVMEFEMQDEPVS